MNELEFENELIEHLTNIGGSKQWQYRSDIKTTEDLWDNFKEILEKNNQDKLKKKLTEAEFAQVKSEITTLKTPFEAGKFLYGLNGVSQVEVDLEDGKHVYLTVFDQAQVGAGNTVYQVVNQIERKAIIANRKARRFDTTLLINGLPIIQIEEKTNSHNANEALNQMEQYIDEQQYTDIFSTVQILVGMTPTSIRYMANTVSGKFNKDFAFQWQREKDNTVVRDWREFSNLVLSIPMAHQMATSYMILDGTAGNQMLKVMRSYQVYATKRVIEKIRSIQFGYDATEAGYIWHTTGSGKTITSFKTAWLASRLPNVDKVVFMVDRVALTNQTFENYQAYDPDSLDNNKGGVISETANTRDLAKKLKNDKGVIVTSIQKMDNFVKNSKFKVPDQNIVFLVDEAHRSVAGDMLQNIKNSFPKAAWVGYTGTPRFEGVTTADIFGEPLHVYTIREAISDRNVLGFKVDFKTTLPPETLKEEYLPGFFKEKYPKWSEEKIQERLENLKDEDMDDMVSTSVYDKNETHVRLVVDDIVENWRNRSNDYRYNAMLTTHVGGNNPSTPMAMMYYDAFKRKNKELVAAGKKHLKVTVTFSQDTSNSTNMLNKNKSLRRVMDDYEQEFGTPYRDDQVKEYFESVMERANKKVSDGKYLDLVIVVDQLLTGFDAAELNTLYVDRTLKGAGLVQAYSRTNRMHNFELKPHGRVINYRWPANSEKLMNEALATFADRASAELDKIERIEEPGSEDADIIAKPYEETLQQAQENLEKISELTDDFEQLPHSEAQQEELQHLMRKYNKLVNELKQDDNYNYDEPEKLLGQLEISKEQEERLTGSLTNDLKERMAENQGVLFTDLSFDMTHINDVEVNFDYISELIADYANALHENDTEKAASARKELTQKTGQMEDRKIAKQTERYINALDEGEVAPEYPMEAHQVNQAIQDHNKEARQKEIRNFRITWGLPASQDKILKSMLNKHILKADDLDSEGSLSELLKRGQDNYQEYAETEEIRSLRKLKYRTQLRESLKKFADELIENY
ncbi:MAG: HsdR family type I site-specific deoxyribonuclease [Micrococcaceae bacterium]